MQKKKSSQSSGFLVMAIFNIVTAFVFAITYLFYKRAGGEDSYLFLLAAGISGIAGIGMFVLYNIFQKKMSGYDDH